jgi:hypothetical protein
MSNVNAFHESTPAGTGLNIRAPEIVAIKTFNCINYVVKCGVS